MTLEKGKGPRPLGALRHMPIVDPELKRKVKQRQQAQRPSTAMSMKDHLESQEEKQRRVDEMQERVNDAVKDYMSNLIQTRTLVPPSTQQQIIVAQPITVPIQDTPQLQLPYLPVAAPANPLDSFVSTGLELLEQDMPRPPTCPATPAHLLRPASPAKSFLRAQTPARPASPEPPATQQTVKLINKETPASPPQPVKLTVKEVVDTPPRPSSPAKLRPKSARPASVRPASVKAKAEDEQAEESEQQKIIAAGDIKRPDEKFNRHWLTWPKTPSVQSERAKTPAAQLYRPTNPSKLRRSKTSYDRPIFTPVPNEFVELDPRPPSGEPPTLNFIPGEPGEYGKAVPYVPAFQSWVKGASSEDKEVVYNMMKSLKAQQVNGAPAHARYVSYAPAQPSKGKSPSSFGVRTSMPAFRPPEMYQVPDGQHPLPCNSCDDYLIKTWAHQVGSEDPKPFAAPTYYRNVQYRPMAKHQTRVPMQRDYHHENSHFQDAQRPYRSHYIIFPDWVSENSHFKKQRQMNGHTYKY